MKIRVIQLINNFFRDTDFENENRERALGTYCTFGYFDALQVKESREISDTDGNPIWKEIDKITTSTLDGTCSRRNLVCMAEDEKKDKEFWDKAKKYPYLFVSLIRVQHSDDVNCVINDTKRDETAIAYYSYNHSELVIVKLETEYAKGMDFVLSLRKKLHTLNIYSIFSVREDILKLETKLKNELSTEKVSVRLRMMIKNDQNIDDFLEKLSEKLFKDDVQEDNNIMKFYTLGNNDLIVEIKSVEMYKLLSCYGMGNLLTHTNTQFGKAVYNIETEILVKGESIRHGKSVDNEQHRET